jgi:hypothetical protein
MKKLVIGFAILGSIAFVGATGRALAADEAAGGGDKAAAGGGAAAGGDDANTTYKAKTVYDFEDDTVEGDLQRPDGELVSAQKKAEHSSLIEIRKDFIPEMLKTLEDI